MDMAVMVMASMVMASMVMVSMATVNMAMANPDTDMGMEKLAITRNRLDCFLRGNTRMEEV